MVKKIFKNYGNYIYLYIFSCFALLLCSHFSPLYEYNFSEDPSIYLTIGRGIMHGLVPYKDLLDIKGPIIFFLYAIFSPMKLGTNYFGIFLLETLALWISVTFIYKTILLVSKSKNWSLILTLIYPFILLNYDSFMNGGEAEEFILPFIFILIYLTFKIINNNYKATKKQYLFLGFSVGFVFWIKYTCLGAWIAFYLCIFFILIMNKKYQELKKMLGYSFLGFLIPTIFTMGYFLINNAFNDLLWGYFGWNYIYGGVMNNNILSALFFAIFHSFSIFFKRNIIIWILVIFIPYLIVIFSNIINGFSKRFLLLSMIFSSTFLELIGGQIYRYYQLMAIPFCVLTFCWIANKFNKFNIKNHFIILFISGVIILGIFAINPTINKSKLYNHIIYQQRFAKTIKKDPNSSTFLDFNELDHGWYNYLNIYPQTKYFNKMNLHSNNIYKPYVEAQLKLINNKKINYVICPIYKYKPANRWNNQLFKNYQIIDQENVDEGYIIKVLLLKRKP